MVQLYYQNFHRSHPVLVPRRALQSPLRARLPAYLPAIMRYIGAHYYPDPLFKESYRAAAYEALAASKDGFRVQALLLLAIVEHAHGSEDAARRSLDSAITDALALGMNRAPFAREHAAGDAVLEESWRRTYWELYVVDGLLAAMSEQGVFRLGQQKTGVKMPCAEHMYNAAVDVSRLPGPSFALTNAGDGQVVPNPHTLDDMEREWAFGDGSHASSFAYRIQAVRNLGQVLEVNRSLDVDTEATVEAVDAALFSAVMRLPSAYDSSSVDEMVFQAEMINYLCVAPSFPRQHYPRRD